MRRARGRLLPGDAEGAPCDGPRGRGRRRRHRRRDLHESDGRTSIDPCGAAVRRRARRGALPAARGRDGRRAGAGAAGRGAAHAMIPHEELGAAAAQPTARGTRISAEGLAAAFAMESRLLGELIAIIRRQREGVAAEDVEEIHDSVFAAHRVLRTMDEARRRRRSLLIGLTGTADVGLDELDAALGPLMTDSLARARDRLRRTARELAGEIAVNRRILQSALHTGEAHMQALWGGFAGPVCYDAGAKPVGESRHGGTLINRQV